MSVDPIRSSYRAQNRLQERHSMPAPRVVRQKPAESPRAVEQREAARKFIGKLRKILGARRALVIDDDPYFCEAFREYLVKKGYQVALAYSGDEGLSLYKESRPDVVFLDVRMPGKSGIETLKELKALDSEAAVIMVSAVEDDDVVQEAKSLGVFYVNKPINFHYLEHAIETTLGLRQGIVSSLG